MRQSWKALVGGEGDGADEGVDDGRGMSLIAHDIAVVEVGH